VDRTTGKSKTRNNDGERLMISLLEIAQSMNEVDDDKIIKYKDKEGDSQEMTAGAAKKQPDDHPAKVAYNKMGDDGGDDGEKDSGGKLGGGDFDRDSGGSDKPESELEKLDKEIKSTEANMNTAGSYNDPRQQDLAGELYQDLEKLKAKRKKLVGGSDKNETKVINGVKYKPIKESKKHPLKENYDRIFRSRTHRSRK